MDTILRIKGAVQNYSWGRRGTNSLAAVLAGVPIGDQPCAELWFGAHPKAPSTISGSDQTLEQMIAKDPVSVLGQRVAAKFNGRLPFLFKILSIGSALSIQAHPGRSRAAELHRQLPQYYPDPNHKPEIAVALSGLNYLAGFTTASALLDSIRRLPELAQVFGDGAVERLKQILAAGEQEQAAIIKQMFCEIFAVSAPQRKLAAEKLRDRILWLGSQVEEDQWFLKNYEMFFAGGDPGLFCFYLLKLDKLMQDEALFTGPNVVHAYLDGEIVECMANSDNVVRVGLTEKHLDVETLLEMVNEPAGIGSSGPLKWPGMRRSAAQIDFCCPAEEFMLQLLTADLAEAAPAAPGELELLVSIDAVGRVEAGLKGAAIEPGTAFFKTAANKNYSLLIESGRLFRVVVPPG